MSDFGPARFHALCHRFGIHSRQASSAWEILHQQYSEPHRHYHNLVHIGKMLQLLDTHFPASPNIELAIWFHDGVYDPKVNDNEIRSARLFEVTFAPFLYQDVTETISRLILVTDPKYPRSGADDEKAIVDIDLAILASPQDEYEAYTQAIRKEYAHVSDEDFKQGRLSILRQFLEAPIYQTEAFADKEAAARKNIEREIGRLSGTGGV